ncbi:Transcription factor MYBC1 [Vitis vinifera]|uniref:Transcription factor MYBC1 n=1 Tax=Vitis vinifera TaxID=29760 RepID=A0A438J7V9_VITVI|nr:Transcription factor MYBC1 [Vitis vinifera]
MREEESNWFSRWEEELPSPEELMPLSQTLITPDLALAFDIRNPNSPQAPPPPLPTPQVAPPPPSQPNSAPEFDSGDLGSGAAGDEPARTLKRPRLVWTPQLHKRFVDAVAHLGIKNAGLSAGGGGGGGGGGAGGGAGLAAADPATDHLFASSPVPPHFLHPGRASSEHFLPFVPVAALQQHHHHHQQMAVAAAAVAAHPQLQTQYHHHRQVGHFGSPPNGQFEHPFLPRQSQPVHRMGAPVHSPVPAYVEDLESATATGGRRVLTLFPTGDD